MIGATNFPDAVDQALVREGRFDRKIQLSLPDVRDRAELFRLFAKRVKTAGALDYSQLARLTTGLTPAAIASAVNQAALISVSPQASSVLGGRRRGHGSRGQANRVRQRLPRADGLRNRRATFRE